MLDLFYIIKMCDFYFRKVHNQQGCAAVIDEYGFET